MNPSFFRQTVGWLRSPALLASLITAQSFASVAPGGAAEPPDTERFGDDAGRPTFVTGDLGSLDLDTALELAALERLGRFATRQLSASGGETLHLRSIERDALGKVHVRADQHLFGLPVVGAQLTLHTRGESGEIYAMGGRFLPAGDLSPEPRVSAEEALVTATAEASMLGELEAGPDLVFLLGADGSGQLAWRGRFRSVATGLRQAVEEDLIEDLFAAADSGRLLDRHRIFAETEGQPASAKAAAHRVLRDESGLIYRGESGALHEALAEIFGGAPTTRPASRVATDFYPERQAAEDCVASLANDRCGVEADSALARLAFDLLARGGQHPFGKTDERVVAVGRDHAEAIFARAQSTYLIPSSGFAEARTATLQAAADLFGAGSREVVSVASTWDAVGLIVIQPPPPVLLLFPSSSCVRLQCDLSFTSAGEPVASVQWTFPDGSNFFGFQPSFFFPGYGSHTVHLVAFGVFGAVASIQFTVDIDEDTTLNPWLGAWYNPQRQGNGFDLYQTSNGWYVMFWYTYTPSGEPIWYLSDPAPKGVASWNATLRQYTYNGSSASDTVVGSVGLDFSTTQVAWFSWTLNGQSGGERYQLLKAGGSTGRSGVWYAPSDSGWGIQVKDSGGVMSSVVTLYSGSQPRWVLGNASSGPDVSFGVTYFNGPGLCPGCSGGSSTPPSGQSAGLARLRIAGSGSATGSVDTNIQLPGGQTWVRSNLPIATLTPP